MFQGLYGDGQIEDLWHNILLISSNLTKSTLSIHRTGQLWQATRASMSIPSVFPPVVQNGELLVDGGLMNNFPSDILKNHINGGFVIGSNVMSTNEIPPFKYDNSFTPWKMVWSRINPFTKAIKAPNLVEVATWSAKTGERLNRGVQYANTDLMIRINAEAYSSFEYDSIEELIQLGYETVARQLEALDQEELLFSGR